MSLWSILTAPLIAGNDLRSMTQGIKDILMNREVIAIDQDKAGKQGRRVSGEGEQEVWAKDLADGARAIGLFNKSEKASKMTVKWSEAGLKGTPKHVRDLWAHADVNASGEAWSGEVPGHGVVLLRAK
jgi:alpha-galactosidase